MPALFCLSQALAFPPSAVGSMSEGGVLIRPLFICGQAETVHKPRQTGQVECHMTSLSGEGITAQS